MDVTLPSINCLHACGFDERMAGQTDEQTDQAGRLVGWLLVALGWPAWPATRVSVCVNEGASASEYHVTA